MKLHSPIPGPRAWLLAVVLSVHPAALSMAAEADDAAAAEAAKPPSQDPAAGGEPPDAAEPSPRGEGQPKPGDDPSVFIPSEEISEDFAVSFPVDI